MTNTLDDEVVIAIKGFDKNFACLGFQYEVGKTYEHEGKVKICESGFHACEHPLNVFKYYPPATSRYALVKQSGQLVRHNDDTKVASAKIIIEAELQLSQIIERAVQWVFARAKWAEGPVAKEPNEGATASGNQGAAMASGNQGAAMASGNQGAAMASGNQGAATASGHRGAATASGDCGAATASGHRGAATASGYQGAATASGHYGAATASGHYGAATASGHSGAATASGYQGAATASGNCGAATASGDCGRAMGAEGCALFLVHRDTNYKITHAWAGIVGQNNIEPMTCYTLNDQGQPTKCEE